MTREKKQTGKLKRVITVGVFDYFHLGHLRAFQQAKEHGSWLICAVQDEKSIRKTKPNTEIFYTTQQRAEMVAAQRIVDEVVIYEDVDTLLPQVDFDVFAVGEDQKHEGFQRAIRWCEENGKKVVYMKRTPGVSSAEIKGKIKNAADGDH